MRLAPFVLLALLVLGTHAEHKVHKNHRGYHFGPHQAGKLDMKSIPHHELKKMVIEDLTTLQGDLDSALESLEKGDLSGLATAPLVDHKAFAHLEELTIQPVAPEVRAKWLDMQSRLRAYHRAKRPDVTLDSKFRLFFPSVRESWVSAFKSVISMEFADTFQSFMVDFEQDLIAGRLSTAQAAINRCERASEAYLAVYHSSSVAKGIVSTLTAGLSDGVSDIAHAATIVGTEVLLTATFETIGVGATLIEGALAPNDDIREDDIGQSIGNIGNATASTGVNVVYAIGTLGVGPLIGWLSGKVVDSIETRWAKDRAIGSCILGAFAAVSESLGVLSSVGAQGVQYQVTGDGELLADAGDFEKLLAHAKTEYDLLKPSGGYVGSEDIYSVLHEDFKVISKFKNVADIIKGPGSGISDTIRQYAAGNEFEKATKYAGASLVAFLKNFYWKVFFQAVTQSVIPIEKAGLIKSLVITGNTEYRPLYERFGVEHDYGTGGKYEKSFGCMPDAQECWMYCGTNKFAGDYCFTRNPLTRERSRLKCRTNADCYKQTAAFWRMFQDVPCATTCGTSGHR